MDDLPDDWSGRYRPSGSESAKTVTHFCGFRHAEVRVARLAAFLRANEGSQDVAAKVAARSGIPLRTVERWLSSTPSEPKLSHFVSLVAAYGPGVIAACFDSAPAWLDETIQRQRADEIEQRIAG